MAKVHTFKRFWIGFDRHAPEFDPAVDEIAVEFIRDFKPHIRVAGGDWQTVDQVSTFDNESETTLKAEFEMNRMALRKYGITHYLEGNHEARLRRVGMKLDPRLRSLLDLQDNLALKRLKITLLPYNPRTGILRIGHLKVLHGFYANEYVAKKTAIIYGSCVFGHCHRFQTHQPKAAFEDSVGEAIGMLGRLDQSWVDDKAPMGWAQGFAFGYLHRNGYYDLYSVRVLEGRVTINGKVYGTFGEDPDLCRAVAT